MLTAGLALIVAGLGLLTRVPDHARFVTDLLPVVLLLGAGGGLTLPSVTTLAMSGVDSADAGLASGLVNTTQQVGGVLGVALLASLDGYRAAFGTATGWYWRRWWRTVGGGAPRPGPRGAAGGRSVTGGARRGKRMTVTTFGIVGSGWRGRFFLRLAATLPDRLRATGVVTRSGEAGAAVRDAWGVPDFRSVTDLLAHERPDYVVVAVPWPVTPVATRELVELGVPVLAETPPAPDLDGLRALWSDVGGTGLVQVAEQYLLMPGHAARLAIVHSGLIGEPTSVQVSSTHLYHAVSLIRGLLGVGYRPATVHARAFTAPLVDPLTPSGWTGDGTPKPARTTLATIDFDGAMGLYDFTDNQWWNPLRTRRIVVRGSLGEIVDDRVVRLADPTTPVESVYCCAGRPGTTSTWRAWTSSTSASTARWCTATRSSARGLSDDDLAVADLAERTGAWARGEAPRAVPAGRRLPGPPHRAGDRRVDRVRRGGAHHHRGLGHIERRPVRAPTRTGHPTGAAENQPVYCTNTLVYAYADWDTPLHESPSVLLPPHWRSRLTDQNVSRAMWCCCA